jgi:GDPmannose 4,6-dehydratase
MEAAWQMLQLDKADDYIIATGETHSVKEWVEEAFAFVNLRADDHVLTDPDLLRPTKTSTLVGNIQKARREFGFNPRIRFTELVRMMVQADLQVEQGENRKS